MSTVDDPRLQRTNEGLESLDTPARTKFGPEPRRLRWTRDQYMRLARRDFFRGKRVELIHGEIIEMSPMNRAQATSIVLLSRLLESIFGPDDYFGPSCNSILDQPINQSRTWL